MLRFKGYQTLEAQTAEEGIRVARERKPALILMDFHLPKMNGIEAFKALRADAATSAIPVIAVNCFGDAGRSQEDSGGGIQRNANEADSCRGVLNTLDEAIKNSAKNT